ncbi:MAG: ADP-ribosylglycohydrolase family protein [Chloroflexi bacterium]|nr:ADP-ribosylglycohydrolase family protein [Chloroflexota bacterium]
MMNSMIDSIHGCLLGLACGDAMGMPGLSSYEQNLEVFGGELTTFVKPVDDPEIDPVHYLLPAGMVTDDTFGAVAIMDAIVRRREVSIDTFVESNIAWVTYADDLSFKFGRDRGLAGPSTSKAIELLQSGVSPYETGKNGMTNGVASRVPPVGFLYPGDLEATVDATELSCIPTHNTNVAISAASAVSCAISVMAAGEKSLDVILEAAKRGAEIGRSRGKKVYCPSVAKRIDLAVKVATSGKGKREICQEIYDLVGTYLPAYEVVPAALGVFALEKGNPVNTLLTAINVGGDGDTLGAIAGALAGALYGYEAFPAEYGEFIENVNHLNLSEKSQAFFDVLQSKPELIK